MRELLPLYAFIDENYRGESFNNSNIRVWYTPEEATRNVVRYRKPDKPPLMLVKLTTVPVEGHEEIDFGVAGNELLKIRANLFIDCLNRVTPEDNGRF